ncbi:MAG: hypothetical protein HY644_13750 [Acidobacteria bacterium]|nr:hypothetical protein [Acidobacteriota bacterium]
MKLPIRLRFTSRTVFLLLMLVLSEFLAVHARADSVKTLYYGIVAAGETGDRVLRTLFHIINGGSESAKGSLSLLSDRGAMLDVAVTPTWVGAPGSFSLVTGQGSFSIPSGSALELALVVPKPPATGWARVQLDDALEIRASVQQAKHSASEGPLSNFEDGLDGEAEIFPTSGVKNFAFPLFLFLGTTRIGTAFSIVNLSAAPGRVQLILRPEDTRTVQLQPGQMLVDFFERFWQVAFPAIFPLKFHGLAEVKSEAPLAIVVLRTREGLPLSGVRPAPLPASEEPVEAVVGAEVPLSINQTATFNRENLGVTFWNVIEDSRCPIDTICIQAGRVTVELRIVKEGQFLGSFQLSTEADSNSIRVGGYSLQLVRVEPAPSSTRRLAISDYRLTLRVTLAHTDATETGQENPKSK